MGEERKKPQSKTFVQSFLHKRVSDLLPGARVVLYLFSDPQRSAIIQKPDQCVRQPPLFSFPSALPKWVFLYTVYIFKKIIYQGNGCWVTPLAVFVGGVREEGELVGWRGWVGALGCCYETNDYCVRPPRLRHEAETEVRLSRLLRCSSPLALPRWARWALGGHSGRNLQVYSRALLHAKLFIT